MSGKKKRMGSHRRSNQTKIENDSLHKEGGATAAELIQTEKSEGDLLASLEYSQYERQHSPLSEMAGHKRKLGSSRSKKGRQHVKDSDIESGHAPTEEVEEHAKDNETLEIKMSIETPRHRNVSDPSEHGVDASRSSLPFLDVMDVLISKSENQQEAPNASETDFGLVSDFSKSEEAKLESMDVSLTQESGDVASESAHYVDISTFHTSPAISQSTFMQTSDNASPVYSLTEKQNRERDDIDLVRQDQPLHAKPFVGTEAAESPSVSELSTKENTLREQPGIECGVEQEITKEEIHLDEEQRKLINLFQVEGARQSENDLVEREAESAQTQDVQHILVSSISVKNEDTPDTGSVKLTDQLEQQGVYRHEDQLEDNIKPTAEQTVHHDMKDLLSEKSGNESCLQTLDTDMNAPLASQYQDFFDKPTDTELHPIASRRKLGSSRRNKGRHHVKDSAVESQNQKEEEVKEKIEDETGGTTEVTSSVEVVMQEQTVETVVEGMDTGEAVKDEVKDDASLVDFSELIHSNVQPGPTVDQQLIVQSESTEMAQEQLLSVDSAPDPQYKEKHEEMEVSMHGGDVYASNVKSESPVKSVEFFQIQETTAEKPSLIEHLKVEYSVNQEILSLPQEEMNLNQQQNEPLNLSEVGEVHQSTDALNEKDTEATETQDTCPVVVTSEPVTHEAMDTSDINSMKLTDQAEISDTYQLTITSTDDSSIQQDVSSPENKDEDSTKQSNLETLDQKKEDSNTREPQIRDLGSRDTEVGHLYEVVDQLEGDLKPATEEVVQDEMKDVPIEDVDRDSSFSTMQMNAPFASQHQDMFDKPTDAELHPIVGRRKLGSSRRNEGRHHVKDSAAESQNQKEEEVKEKVEDETGGTTEVTSSVEVVMQEQTVEPVVEGMDTGEAVKDEVKDDPHLVDFSELIHLNVQPGPTVDQQLIVQSESTEMAQEKPLSVDSAPDPQYKEKHEETEVPMHGGDVYASNVKSESPVKSEDVEFFQIQEATAEKPSLIEDLKVVYGVDQEILSLPQEEMNLNQQQNEPLNLSEVGEARQSTDALNEKDTEATETQDTCPVVVTSEPVTHQAMDTSDINSMKLTDTGLSQVQKDEGQVEDDLKPAIEDAVHHELKEVPSEVGEMESSLQTIQTEMNAPIPSEHGDIFGSEEKQAPMSNRRKLGSSRRIKQRQHVQDSADSEEEVKEDFSGNKDSLPTEVSKIRDNSPLAGTSEINISSAQSSPPVDSQLADQTHTREMPHDDLHGLDSAPVQGRREEETGTAKQDGNVQTNNLVKDPHVKSEEKESPKIEITLEYISSETNTKPESNVNEAFVSSIDEVIQSTLQTTPLEMHIGLDTQPLENPEQTQTSIETIEDGGTKNLVEVRENYNADAEGSVNVNVPGHDEGGLQRGAPEVKETPALDEFAFTELFPVPRNETQTEAQLDAFLEERIKAEASTEESSMSVTGDEWKDHGSPVVDQGENLQIKPQQKRRKMGSTRRLQTNRKQEDENKTGADNLHTDTGVRDHDKTEVEPLQSETQQESDAFEEERKSQSNATIDLMAAIPPQVEPHGEAVVNPVMFATAASVCDSEKNEDVIFNTSQPVDSASAEIHVPFVVAKSSSISMNQLLPTDTENAALTSVNEMSQSAQNDDRTSESLRKKESEDSNEQKPLISVESPAPEIVKEDSGEEYNMRETNMLHEGASNANTETKNESPDLNLTKKRRKMGSTRKSLGTRTKREDLNEKQADDTEDAEAIGNAGDATSQTQTEHEVGKSEQGTEKGFETADYSNTGDTCKTSAPQQLHDENPVSQGPREDADRLLSDDPPEIPSASSNLEAMSDTAAGGRRRKMGSHRRSHGPPTTKQGEITDTQNGSDARIVKDESVMKTAEKKMNQIPEVNESYTNPFSTSTSSTYQTVSEKPSEPVIPVQTLYPDVQLDRERQTKVSSGYTRRANLSDVMYDVVMIGDSCVGKTSFMKRAQNGKFSLDLPASVGLDSCLWTVIVNGKPVVLHLWDTAGQERFRSLTRQTFHKAQAFLLMYDVSSVESFSAINYWVTCIKEGAAEDVIILLLGNKCDHAKRRVTIQQGENLAKEYNFDFMECSAATGENVIESLETVARLLSQKDVTTEETLVLLQNSKPKNKSGCC